MLKEHSNIFKLSIVIVDIVILLFSFWAAYQLRLIWSFNQLPVFPVERYTNLLYLSIPVTILALSRAGMYHSLWNMTMLEVFFRTLMAVVIAGIVCAAYLFLSKSAYFSRLFFGIYFCLGSATLIGEKLLLKFVQLHLARRGVGLKNVLILGEGPKLSCLLEHFNKMVPSQNKIVAVLPLSTLEKKQLHYLLAEEVIDEVYIAFSRKKCKDLDIGSILKTIEEYGKPIKVLINLDETLRFSKIDFLRVGNFPALVFYSKNMDPDLLIVKRIIDITGGFVGLCLTAIFFPFIALAIKLDSPGPIFFVQERVGLNGRRFKLYKFRSMYVNAEQRKQELLRENETSGPIFKISHDPRVTRVGRFLRRTSLDELPQFWNVIKGDMSLVGTRPPTPDEVNKYRAWHYRRICIKPGITGLWQVSGRSKIKDFDQIVALDIEYIQNWSFWLDMKILLKTLYLLLRPSKSGAV